MYSGRLGLQVASGPRGALKVRAQEHLAGIAKVVANLCFPYRDPNGLV